MISSTKLACAHMDFAPWADEIYRWVNDNHIINKGYDETAYDPIEGAGLLIDDELVRRFFHTCSTSDIHPERDGVYAVTTRYTRTRLIEGRWQTTIHTCVHVCILAYNFDVCIAKAVIPGAPDKVKVECIKKSRDITAVLGTFPMFRVAFHGPDGSRQTMVTTARMENDTVHLVQYDSGVSLADPVMRYLTVADGVNIEVKERSREVIRVTELQMNARVAVCFELSFGGVVFVEIPMFGELMLQKVGRMHTVDVYLLCSERNFIVGVDCNEMLCSFCHELHDRDDDIQVRDGVLFKKTREGNLLQARFRPNPESLMHDCVWTLA